MRYTTLLSPAELAPHLLDPHWVVIDCRHHLMQPEAGWIAYQAGHIPEARFAHVDHDLSGPQFDPDGIFRGRHPLPSREEFVATLRTWGINQDSQVIAYDDQEGLFAARLWWMLRWVGHEAVAVLEGGFSAWDQAGLPVSTQLPNPSLGNSVLQPALVPVVDITDVLANLNQPVWTIVDARAADRFRGENETIDPVGGHIPGAKNRSFKLNLQSDGRFKSAEQLKAEWADVVTDPSKSVMQCGSGISACHNLLALEIAGLSGAALYPGSWSEWCANPSRPIAVGTSE